MGLPNYVYKSILPWQTRIISLHGHCGSPDADLQCDIYPAYLLHDKFEGIAVQLPSGDQELVTFEALSYTWGVGEASEKVICGGSTLPIGSNLFDALRHLRYPTEKPRYLWVDAICLNQKDSQEKGHQIKNMFTIYTKAKRVVAWLGNGDEVTEDLKETMRITNQLQDMGGHGDLRLGYDYPYNKEIICGIQRFLRYLYTREWFGRIWVQQEVFAARKLTLQCGNYRFHWVDMFSDPSLLHGYLDPREPSSQHDIGTPDHEESRVSQQHTRNSFYNETKSLKRLCYSNLTSFEMMRAGSEKRKALDLVEILLSTGTLGATNPLDYVYGTAGITTFPMKPMPINDWVTQRPKKAFIPIDYEIEDPAILLAAVTWVMIMTMGLGVVAKFKLFDKEENPDQSLMLPSWAINWTHASSSFAQKTYFGYDETRNTEQTPFEHAGRSKLQWKFMRENTESALPWNKIRVRGIITKRIKFRGDTVYDENRIATWKLQFTTKKGDIAVYLAPFDGQSDSSSDYGIWILRRATDDTEDLAKPQREYKLMAYLSWFQKPTIHAYESWKFTRYSYKDGNKNSKNKDSYRHLSVPPDGGLPETLVRNVVERHHPLDFGAAQLFIIV